MKYEFIILKFLIFRKKASEKSGKFEIIKENCKFLLLSLNIKR